MKRLALAALVSMAAPTIAAAQQVQLERHDDGTISAHLYDAPLPSVLLELGSLGGLNVIFDAEDLAGLRVSAHLQHMAPQAALRVVLDSQSLDYQVTDDAVIVHGDSQEDIDRLLRQARRRELQGGGNGGELPGPGPGPTPPSDVRADLTLGTPYTGPLAAGEQVWLRLRVTEAAAITLQTEGSDFDTVLTLCDAERNELETNDDGGPNRTSVIRRALEPGTYLLQVRGYDANASGTVVCTAQAAAPGLQPANGTVTQELRLGEEYTGEVPAGQVLWLRLIVEDDTEVVINTQGSAFDTVMALFNAAQESIAEDDDGGPERTSRIETELSAGQYLIAVAGFDANAFGAVRVRAFATGGPGSDADTALPLDLGGSHQGTAQGESGSWLRVTVEAPGVYRFHTEGSPLDTILALLDGEGALMAQDDDGGTGTTSKIEAFLQAGDYLLRVTGFNGASGAYTCAAEQLDLEAYAGESIALAPGASAWRRVQADQTGLVLVEVTGAPGSLMDLYAMDSGEAVVTGQSSLFGELAAGEYVLRLQAAPGDEADRAERQVAATISPVAPQSSLEVGGVFGSDGSVPNLWIGAPVTRGGIHCYDASASTDLVSIELYEGTELLARAGADEGFLIEELLGPGEYLLRLRSSSTEGETRLSAGRIEPYALAPGAPFSGEVDGEAGAWLCLIVEGEAAEVFALSTEGSAFDTRLEVYDEAGVRRGWDDDGGPDRSSRLALPFAPGAYYVRLTGYEGAGGAATCSVTREAVVDAPLGEPFAVDLPAGASCWLRAPTRPAGVFHVHAAGEGYFTATLFGTDGQVIAQDDDDNEGNQISLRAPLVEGVHIIRFTAEPEEGAGQITGSVEALPCVILTPDQPVQAELAEGEEAWFAITAEAAQSLTFSTSGSSFDTVLGLYDADGHELDFNDDVDVDGTSLIQAEVEAGQTYYLRLRGYSNDQHGAYTMQARTVDLDEAF